MGTSLVPYQDFVCHPCPWTKLLPMCPDRTTFGRYFKVKWPLAAADWQAAASAKDASKQRTAETMIRLLRTELDTYTAPYS